MIAARTDVITSLLRPRKLLQTRELLERGEIDLPEFKRVEDTALTETIRLQQGVDLAVGDHGQMRHLSCQNQLTKALKGFSDGISRRSYAATSTGG